MTRKLVIILIILLISFVSFITINKFDVIKNYLLDIYDKIFTKELIIKDANEYKRNYEYKSLSKTDNFHPENKEDIKKIYYTIIDNGWDDFIFYCPKKYKECAKDAKDVAEDDNFLTLVNNYVSPYNAYKNYNTTITDNKEIYVKIDYLYNDEEIKEANELIDNIFLSLKPNIDNPSYLDIKDLHHYLIYNVSYDDDYVNNPEKLQSNKVNGTLINKKAICSGYSDTFALMMDRLNIPNFKISNDTHIWNVIYFNNKWSHIDVTWDDDEINPSNYSNFFMIDTTKLHELNKDEHEFNEDLYLELK